MTEREKAAEAIHADMACEEAFARIVGDCSDEIDSHLFVFFGSEDESGPHKARVALRRLTTALDAFAPILRRKAGARARRDAKEIFRALGRVRDADVFLAAHGGGEGGKEDRALTRETEALREAVRRELRANKAVAYAPALMRMIAEGGILKEGAGGRALRAAPVGDLAARALTAAWSAGVAAGDAPFGEDVEAMHDFRKDMKTLRYLSEFFSPLWPGEDWPRFRALLQDLQDELGLLNDLANARARGRVGESGKEDKARARSAALWQELRARGPFWHAAPRALAEAAPVPPEEAG
ncbi:CHAD domain-containing protein [Pseudogemmobacter sonorensis]|uniref:CHAD domain-containing protein n=1 Tax=Pseudogemmobacter sonorensis TaxID=2989681 RepID=UPI0036CA170A